jgi:hypothetical protein
MSILLPLVFYAYMITTQEKSFRSSANHNLLEYLMIKEREGKKSYIYIYHIE